MTAMETPKKKSGKKAPIRTTLDRAILDEAIDEYLDRDDAALHVVADPKPEPKPGEKDFDWQTEYPGEEFYVYTVPESAKKSPTGRQSPIGLTIGLAKITEDRAPNPGEMMEAEEIGGFKPMWLFISYVASPTALTLMKQLRPAEYNDLLRGWAKFAGIELSE